MFNEPSNGASFPARAVAGTHPLPPGPRHSDTASFSSLPVGGGPASTDAPAAPIVAPLNEPGWRAPGAAGIESEPDEPVHPSCVMLWLTGAMFLLAAAIAWGLFRD